MGSPEGIRSSGEGLPNSTRQLERGQVLGKIVDSVEDRGGPTEGSERGHTQTGSDAKPILLANLNMDTVFYL